MVLTGLQLGDNDDVLFFRVLVVIIEVVVLVVVIAFRFLYGSEITNIDQ